MSLEALQKIFDSFQDDYDKTDAGNDLEAVLPELLAVVKGAEHTVTSGVLYAGLEDAMDTLNAKLGAMQ